MLDRGMSEQDVIDAGYFEDNFQDRDLIRNIENSAILNKMKTKEKGIIIALSGCFSPLHQGHLNAISLARNHFESLGFNVIGSILYPAHDSYVNVKQGGKAQCLIKNRLEQIDRLIHLNKEEEFIFVDDFPALALKNEINFPFLIDRLQAYGKHFNCETAFVVGGDNAKFAYAFQNSETHIVIVNRKDNVRIDYSYCTKTKIYRIKDNLYSDLSSTKIRAEKPLYLVRDDSELAIGVEKRYFVRDFCKLLGKYVDAEVKCFSAKEQIEYVKNFLHITFPKMKILSLDKWFKGDFNLDISRVFQLAGDQTNPICYRIREAESLKAWIQLNDDFIILDDDSASGGTSNCLTKTIFEICPKKKFHFMSMDKIFNVHQFRPVYDIVDMRDFIPNAKFGGLLCSDDKGDLAREIYLHPKVQLEKRMKLKSDIVLDFSEELKVLIERHFPCTQK